MSFALIIVGLFLLISSVRGTNQTLIQLVRGDLTGPNNFVFWVLAILAIGAVGYIPKAKPLSAVLLALVIVVLFLKKGGGGSAGGAGFFQQFFAQVSKATTQTTSTPAASGAPASLLTGFNNPLGQLGTLPVLTA